MSWQGEFGIRLRRFVLFFVFFAWGLCACVKTSYAEGGDVDSPDLEVQGYTIFGTNATDALSVTSGWGNVYIDDSLEVHSNVVVQGKVQSLDVLEINRYGLVQGAQLLTGLVPIEPTSSYLRVQGDSSNIDMLCNPQIAGGYPGQLLTLQGTANDRLVKIEDGDGVQTQMDQPFSLGLYDTLQLIYDNISSNWVEINRSNNRSTN